VGNSYFSGTSALFNLLTKSFPLGSRKVSKELVEKKEKTKRGESNIC
jgi:hypothetical protein